MEIEELLVEFRDVAESYAKSKAHLTYLEEFKKAKVAMLMKVAQSKGVQTASGQEREAYSHDEYIDLLNKIREATESETRDKFVLRKIEMEIEVWRTNQANERMERKAYGA